VSGDQAGVAFADFVAALRDQIRAAQVDADPGLPIEIGPVSVEFTLLTRREGEGKAGVRFWVVEAGVSGRMASESTQKVTMQLQPLGPGGEGRARVRDRERP
jgi:Trypsin-co-occurring domain 2